MYKQQTLQQSFKNAITGFAYAVKEERNMRVAITFIPPVVVYSFFAGLSKIELSIIIICLSIVCISELINSSIENAIDSVIKEYNPLAGKAKDMGAAGTLTASVMSAVVGLIILYKPEKLLELLTFFKKPLFLICVIIYIIISLVFILSVKTKRNGA